MADEVKTDISEEEPPKPKKKNFFKSVSFKCIVVLLAIVLVCGILLTICNSLFEVTNEERLQRAISKIYGETIDEDGYEVLTVDESISIDDTTINAVYEITSEGKEGDYLLNATGSGGYGGGTVTCYVLLNVTNSELSVKAVTISENTSQSYISRIKSSTLESFAALFGTDTSSTSEYYVLYNSKDGFYTDDPNSVTNHLATGATYSMGAICNAVNGSIDYINATVLGIAVADPFESFDYTTYINKDNTSYVVNTDGSVTYSITTKGYSCTGYYGNTNSFIFTITVGTDGKISSYSIDKNGSTSSGTIEYADRMTYDYTTKLIGMGESDIIALFGGGEEFSAATVDTDTIGTGATLSNFVCLYSALFAVGNYDLCVGGAE